MASNKSNIRKIGRHAGTGQFLPVEKAIKLGDRAVVETIRTPTKSSTRKK